MVSEFFLILSTMLPKRTRADNKGRMLSDKVDAQNEAATDR